MKSLLTALTILFCLAGLAYAHGGHNKKISDLKSAPPSHQVMGVEYCEGKYRVIFKDGSASEYPEFNLRFKTDSGPTGPHGGSPVQISAGMRGDRAYLVFSDPQEISGILKKKC